MIRVLLVVLADKVCIVLADGCFDFAGSLLVACNKTGCEFQTGCKLLYIQT